MKKILIIIAILLGTINMAYSDDVIEIATGQDPSYTYEGSGEYSSRYYVYKFYNGTKYLYRTDIGDVYNSISEFEADIIANGGIVDYILSRVPENLKYSDSGDPYVNYDLTNPEELAAILELVKNLPEVENKVKETLEKLSAQLNPEPELIESPITKKKKSKADKLVDTLTGKNEDLNSIGDFNRLLEKYGDIYINIPVDITDNTTIYIQHKNEHGKEYTGVAVKVSVDFNCIIFNKCRK